VDCVEDYTAAPILDGGEPISSFKPTVHSLPRCHLGTIDGRHVDVGSGSILPAPIPALGELGPAFNQRLDDSDRRERARSAATEDLISTRRSRPWEDDRRAPSRSLSRARTHRRSRSAESKDRRRSHSRMESRCDDRQLRKRHHREDDDDEDRREPRRESSRRSSSRSLRAKSAGHHRGSREGRSYGHGADGSTGRRDGYRRHFVKKHGAAAEPLVRPKLPSIITCVTDGKDWSSTLKELPPAFARGFSHLASPPLKCCNSRPTPAPGRMMGLTTQRRPLFRLPVKRPLPRRFLRSWCRTLGKTLRTSPSRTSSLRLPMPLCLKLELLPAPATCLRLLKCRSFRALRRLRLGASSQRSSPLLS
jgi:hypothetical protein